MGLYTIDCPECGEPHQWFSGNTNQSCEKCKVDTMEVHGFVIESMDIDRINNVVNAKVRLKTSIDYILVDLDVPSIQEAIKEKLETPKGEMSKFEGYGQDLATTVEVDGTLTQEIVEAAALSALNHGAPDILYDEEGNVIYEKKQTQENKNEED